MATMKLNTMTQGADVKEIISGAAGLALTTMVPGMLIKPAPGTSTLTQTQSYIKLGVSAGLAIVSGIAAKSLFKSPDAAKAAFIGGIAGTAIQLVNTLKPGTIASQNQISGRRIGESLNIPPQYNRSDEQVQLIRP